MVSPRRAALLAAALLLPSAAGAAPPECGDLLAPGVPTDGVRRPVTAADLVRLRDIGPVNPQPPGARLMGLSPDGTRIAFQLSRADPVRNGYCLALVVLDLDDRAVQIVDRGSEPILVTYEFRGKADFPTGVFKVITPRWSPDGRWLAYLKQCDGTVQVWRVEADGSGARPLTNSPVDVEDFRIVDDGRTLLYTSRPGLADASAAIAREALSGWHYDDRWSPASARRPFPAAPVPTETFALDLGGGVPRPASAAEARLLDRDADAPDAAIAFAGGAGGRRAWTFSPEGRSDRLALAVAGPDGTPTVCAAVSCRGRLGYLWLAPGGRRLRYLRREGWADASTALYEWSRGRGAPRRLMITDDVLSDCVADGAALICLREGSLQPRRIERLEPASGRREILFDPNPEFAWLATGRTERLHWTNAYGLEAVGDLVLPVGGVPEGGAPLVVVQYDTRGFLRGGTGDEYPIQAFAGRGYAILSVSRPPAWGRAQGLSDEAAISRANLQDFADRRSAFSTVETGVRLLLARGIADPERLGITGMSDGATTATFALLHSDLFAAAAMSNCCFDTTLPTRVGPAAARYFRESGYPGLTDEGDAFWAVMSLSRNARRVRTPILLQVADDEYMSALESFTALREVGAPADMYVFEGEHHSKWQPAHRLAAYTRALDWFDYWLLGKRSSDPGRRDALAAWDALRAERENGPQSGDAASPAQ